MALGASDGQAEEEEGGLAAGLLALESGSEVVVEVLQESRLQAYLIRGNEVCDGWVE